MAPGRGLGGVLHSKAVPMPMGRLCGKYLNDILLDSLFLKIVEVDFQFLCGPRGSREHIVTTGDLVHKFLKWQ